MWDRIAADVPPTPALHNIANHIAQHRPTSVDIGRCSPVPVPGVRIHIVVGIDVAPHWCANEGRCPRSATIVPIIGTDVDQCVIASPPTSPPTPALHHIANHIAQHRPTSVAIGRCWYTSMALSADVGRCDPMCIQADHASQHRYRCRPMCATTSAHTLNHLRTSVPMSADVSSHGSPPPPLCPSRAPSSLA